jgi:predicted transcriptional regulator
MSIEHGDLTAKIIRLLENDSGQAVKDIVKRLDVNKTFFAYYLNTIENQSYIKSKRIGLAKVYSRRERLR